MIAFDRRTALLGMLTTAAVTAVPVRGAAAPASSAALLRAAFTDSRAAAALGLAYLRDHPAEAAPARLAAALGMPADVATQEAARDWLRAAARQDFAAGRVATVAGWTLSQREARAMALVALG